MTGLAEVLAGQTPFALLYRPESTGRQAVEVLTGPIRELRCLAELTDPRLDPAQHAGRPELLAPELLAIVPYRQLAERGFGYPADDTPLLAMTVEQRQQWPLPEALAQLPDCEIGLRDGGFDIDDEAYAELVGRVISHEIGRGEGSNFVMRRSFTATIEDYSPAVAGALFRRLLLRETGAYWTFLVYTGQSVLVGASPERHLSVADGLVVMNPISGTYRYPAAGASLPDLLAFLANGKESNELYMVLDEELKMMAAICPDGGRVVGPFLKEMSHLAHTEYFIEGRSGLDIPSMLRHTLFAPTVTGSPVENACRVIARYEPSGRGYYSGVLALIGSSDSGLPSLDSAIMIRTAQVDRDGRLALGVGSTIVRDSDPLSEAAETRAKASGMLAAIGCRPESPSGPPQAPAERVRLAEHPLVGLALARRNAGLARFWLREPGPAADRPATAERATDPEQLTGSHGRVLVIDAEDTFTAMLATQIARCGPEVVIRDYREPLEPDGFDLAVLGPGPGDPDQRDQPKIAMLHRHLRQLLARRQPILGICLGHQIVCGHLGLPLRRRPVPDQGVQRTVRLFGKEVRVGFYCTFTACSDVDEQWSSDLGASLDISRDVATGEIYGLQGPGLRSYQFHPESILSTDGFAILADALRALLPEPATSR